MKNISSDPVSLTADQVLPIDKRCLASAPTAETRSAHKKRMWLVAWITLGLVFCLGIGGVFATLASRIATESPKVERVLEDFMTAMARKDVQTAYALFSTRAKSRFPPSDLEKFSRDPYYFMFDGYQDVTVTNFSLNASFNNDPEVPQGVTAKVQGTVSYEGTFAGTLTAVLEQEGDAWRLINFNVVVPPDKLAR